MTDTVLDAGEAAESMTDKTPCFHGADVLEGTGKAGTERLRHLPEDTQLPQPNP